MARARGGRRQRGGVLLARLAAVVYVAAPGLLVLTDSSVAYRAALVLALPLSLAANMLAYVVAALTLPGLDSNGLPIAAAALSGAALVQALAAREFVRRRRASRGTRRESGHPSSTVSASGGTASTSHTPFPDR